MIISSELFEAYLKCPTKCYLKARGETGSGNDYDEWLKNQNETFCNDGIKRLTTEAASDWFFADVAESKKLKAAKWRLAINLKAETQNLKSTIHAVERVPSEGRGKPAQFIPMRFVFNNKLTKNDRCCWHSMPWYYRKSLNARSVSAKVSMAITMRWSR
jgi:hypothetical protein